MRRALLSAFIYGYLLLAGCEAGERVGISAPRSPVGPVPVEPQRPGDPERGYRALVTEPYVSCGIPYAAYRESADPPPPSHRLPGREGRNAELPYNFTAHTTKDGVELVVANCLTCHAGFFDGRLIVGLGNEALDFTEERVPYIEGLGAYVQDEKAAREWRKWADRLEAIGPYSTTDTVGLNPAINITWALFAHRDPKTLAWSQAALIAPPPTRPLPATVPPWWRMKKKHAMFDTTAGRGDHARLMILASTLCTDSVEEAQAIDAYAPDIRAFIESLQPPAYPFATDQALAARGHLLFEANCTLCHGTYGENWTYQNLVIDLARIGTDPAVALAATGGSEDRFLRWLGESFYGEYARLVPARGYVAPPLDGVWATAPYLHNGSVPTIDALLNSGKRPRYWRRSFDSKDYDQERLGWRYTELAKGKEETDPNSRKWVYDTTLPGATNSGHAFGDHLNEGERRAVLEYLKTL